MNLDSRLLLARPDLADAALEGLMAAERFATPRPMQVLAPAAPVLAEPRPGAEMVDQMLFGELFAVLEAQGDFAWGQAVRDGYVGWTPLAALGADVLPPTHRVAVPSTLAFAEPSIKSAAGGPYSLNTLVRVNEERGRLSQVEGAGWMPSGHLAQIGACFQNPADVAEALLGAPYLWGGRSSLGLDCSGLVQQALYAAGLASPRDTDQQQTLGEDVGGLRSERGDLVFWRGHVGMMLDETRLLHANAHHMAVTAEPFAGASQRIAAAGGGDAIAFRRLPLACGLEAR